MLNGPVRWSLASSTTTSSSLSSLSSLSSSPSSPSSSAQTADSPLLENPMEGEQKGKEGQQSKKIWRERLKKNWQVLWRKSINSRRHSKRPEAQNLILKGT